MSRTRRQELIRHLQDGPATLRDLAELTGARIRDVASDLEHALRSADGELSVEPARCLQCDFVFARRRRYTRPSRCPQCRSERISWPVLELQR